MSLGKGLESLIPPNQGKKPDPSVNGQVGQPVQSAEPALARSQPEPAHIPAALPESPREELLPAPPEEKLLEAQNNAQPSTPNSQSSAKTEIPRQPARMNIRSDEPRDDRKGEYKSGEAIFYLEVDKIRPNENQPRKHFDEEAIKELASSIREFGVIQPIVVTKHEREVPQGTEVDYELIAGERRLMAAKSLGMERIPAIIRRVDARRESLELAIIENLQREDLSAIEMARAFARLTDEFRLTQREIATRLGKSRETVANTMRLLDLPTSIQDAIGSGRITESHGLFLLGIDNPMIREQLFHELVENKLTIRELRARAGRLKPKKAGSLESHEAAPEVKMIEERLASELGAPVSIQQKGESGKITINFFSKEELEQIVEKMSRPEE